MRKQVPFAIYLSSDRKFLAPSLHVRIYAYPHLTARLAVRNFTAARAVRQSESSCDLRGGASHAAGAGVVLMVAFNSGSPIESLQRSV